MRITITLSKHWTFDEVRKYLANPQASEYEDEYYLMYDLLSCAMEYVKHKDDESFTEEEMNRLAEKGLEYANLDYLYDSVMEWYYEDGYKESCDNYIHKALEKTRSDV